MNAKDQAVLRLQSRDTTLHEHAIEQSVPNFPAPVDFWKTRQQRWACSLSDGSREAALRRAMAVLAALDDIDPLEVHLYNFASFTDLIHSGVSDDEDMRVFEIGWKGQNVSAWVEHPLFVTDDISLLGK